MARPADRMRLKDKLVDNVSKAIKSIQGVLYYQSQNADSSRNLQENSLVIDNRNHLSHKLLDSLDHALLHGIRNVTHGYWKVVKQLSHKDLVKEIELLTNVTTDLGRGRAWLHASLNEGLLESYIRMLTEHEKLVRKHYAKDSLVLDGDKMNVLLTLTSGLDYVTFQLEYDLPYLDLNPSPPRTRADFQDEEDSYARPSSTSHRPSFAEPRLESPSSARAQMQSDSDSTSISSYDTQAQGDRRSPSASFSYCAGDGGIGRKSSMQNDSQLDIHSKTARQWTSDSSKMRSITPTDSTSISSVGSTGEDRHMRLENIVVGADAFDNSGDVLEVIHVMKSKKGNSAKKLKRKKLRQNSVDETSGLKPALVTKPSQDSLEETSSEKTDVCRRPKSGTVELNKVLGDISDMKLEDKTGEEIPRTVNNIPGNESGCDNSDRPLSTENVLNDGVTGNSNVRSFSYVDHKVEDNVEDVKVKNGNCVQSVLPSAQVEVSPMAEIARIAAAMAGLKEDSREDESSDLSDVISFLKNDTADERDYSTKDYSGHTHLENKVVKQVPSDNAISKVTPDLTYDRQETKTDQTSVPRAHHQLSKSHEAGHHKVREQISDHLDTDNSFEGDIYSSSYHDDTDVSSNATQDDASDSTSKDRTEKKPVGLHGESHLQDYMDFILKSKDSPDSLSPKDVHDGPLDLSVSLDNNMKLQVMLEIFTLEDETLVKMFVCWENHTEGDPAVAFVLVSDQYLYILNYKNSSRKFTVQSSARLIDIIFISTGLNEQTLNIESRGKSRQKQRLWLTPGHKALTLAMVDCLSEAVKKAMEHFSTQGSRFSVGSDIPLQKIGLRKYISKEINIEPQDIEISDYSLVYWEDPSACPEKDVAKKEGTLLLYTQDPSKGHIWKPVYVVIKNGMLCISNKKDTKPHSYLGLGGDQCVGCRRTSVGEKLNCLELVLAQAGSWFLSAVSTSELADWSQALCLAVSQGRQEEGLLLNCTPCCAILACKKIFMCHEDLNTRFFRTLGQANLEDVTGISVDEKEQSYCIVEFESTEERVSSVQWVFYFASASDADRFVSALDACWKAIFEVDIPVTQLDNLTLQHRCQNHVKRLRNALHL